MSTPRHSASMHGPHALQRLSPQLAFPLPLETIIRQGICGSEGDRAAIAVAGLRTAGIPARLATLGDGFTGNWGAWVEFFDGKTWTPFYPTDPRLLGNDAGTPAARCRYAPQMRIELQTTAHAELSTPGTGWNIFHTSSSSLIKQEKNIWGRDWTLCRITPQGTFVPARDVALSTLSGTPETILLELPQGRYVLVQSKRDRDGWSTWSMERLGESSAKQH